MFIRSVTISEDSKLRLHPNILTNWSQSGAAVIFPLEYVWDIKTSGDLRMQAWGLYSSEEKSLWSSKISDIQSNAKDGGKPLDQLRASNIFECSFNTSNSYIQLLIPKEIFILEWLKRGKEVFIAYENEGVMIWTVEAYKFQMTYLEKVNHL